MEQLSLLPKVYEYGESLSSEEMNQIVLHLNSSIEAINYLLAKNNGINDGHCEMRYKVSAQLPEAPAAGSNGKSNGWSDTYTKPDTDNGEITWMTLCFLNGDGIYGAWSNPVCITWGSIEGLRGRQGETGIRGSFKSRVFKRQNSRPDTPTGGTYESPFPTSGGWTDGIPQGNAIIWSSVCTFHGDGTSSGWSAPASESDSATLDVEFSPLTIQPSAPIGNVPFANHESEGWYDPNSVNFESAGTMIWRAERKVSNGEYDGDWTITRIYGEKGDKGDPGNDGGHYEFRYRNYIPSALYPAPSKPATGSNGTTDGWSRTQQTLSETDIKNGSATWMTQCYVNDVGEYGEWTPPIRITGANGLDGEDGTIIEFVYTRNNTGITPSAPPTTQVDDWHGTLNLGTANEITWTDNPLGVLENMMYEYISLRSKINDVWTEYSTPVIWSKWGEKGMDGDGIEYIFKHFSYQPTWGAANASSTNGVLGGNNNPANWTRTQTREFYGPSGYEWSDDPTGVDSTNKFEYVSVREFKLWPNETKKKWGTFSTPALWAKYAADSTVAGPPGTIGPMSYLAGVWNSSTTYTKTTTKNPIVYRDTVDKYYYLKRTPTESTPITSREQPPESNSSVWAQAENYDTVFTDILFVKTFSKLGSFIVNEDWVISQYGIIYDSSGTAHIINSDNASWTNSGVTYVGEVSTSGQEPAYNLFDPYHPNIATAGVTPGRTPNFVPYAAINAKTGESYFTQAHITGEVRASSGVFNGTVNATNGTFRGNVEASTLIAGDPSGINIRTTSDKIEFCQGGDVRAYFVADGNGMLLHVWDSSGKEHIIDFTQGKFIQANTTDYKPVTYLRRDTTSTSTPFVDTTLYKDNDSNFYTYNGSSYVLANCEVYTKRSANQYYSPSPTGMTQAIPYIYAVADNNAYAIAVTVYEYTKITITNGVITATSSNHIYHCPDYPTSITVSNGSVLISRISTFINPQGGSRTFGYMYDGGLHTWSPGKQRGYVTNISSATEYSLPPFVYEESETVMIQL